MNIAPAGDRALLVELGHVSATELHAAAHAVRSVPEVVACVVGQASLYVVFDSAPDPATIVTALGSRSARQPSTVNRQHHLKTSFASEYAPDLPRFLEHVGATSEEFLRRIDGMRLTARYLGFRAGFAYLDGWPPEWAMPRRPTARAHVPHGTFGIAGAVAGFYPIDSPGGWNLLGRTDAVLWDESREPPNLLAAGDELVIEPTLERLQIPAVRRVETPMSLPYVDIVAAHLAVVVTTADWRRVDSGRPPGGPFDPAAGQSVRQACSLRSDWPVLECAMVGPTVKALEDVIGSWYGADADVRVDGSPVADVRQFSVRKGQEIAIGRITNGLRGWLAIGRSPGSVASSSHGNDRHQIRVAPGPHTVSLMSVDCEVTPRLDRVGIRMRPLQSLGIEAPADLPSCGMQCGTVQLHPDGTMVIMGPDHPVTGGYLQPLTILSTERWKIAQLSPGDKVSFRAP